MLYDYKCTQCSNVFELARRMDERDDVAICTCGSEARYKFTPTTNLNAGAAAFKQEHYHAFGKGFSTKNDLKQHISRLEGQTGKRINEIGSDRMTGLKPKKTKVNKEAATRELAHMIKHGIRHNPA